MANFTKTIANGIVALGGSPSSKWGQANSPYTMTWGSTKWGEGTFSIVFSVEKLIANSLLPDSSILTEFQKIIVNSILADGDLESQKLSDGAWNYVFTSETTEAEDRDFTGWDEATDQTTTYTADSDTPTVWS